MITSYILITTESRNPILIAQDLTYLEEVENVHQTTGAYNLVARVSAKNMIELREHTLKKIDTIKGITKTTTLLIEN